MKTTILLFLAAGTLSTCAPKPKAACQQLLKIYGTSSTRPQHLATQEMCEKTLNKYKKRWGVNGYRRYTECVLGVGTQFEAQRCYKKEKRRSE